MTPENKLVVERANLLKAISNPVRLCIVKRLYKEGGLNVTYLYECMGVSQSSVSQHLAKLRDMGIVEVKKNGLESTYYIKDETVKRIIDIIF